PQRHEQPGRDITQNAQGGVDRFGCDRHVLDDGRGLLFFVNRCGGACAGVRSFGGTAFFVGGDGLPKFYGCGGRLLGLPVRRELLRRCGGFDGCRNGRFGCGLQDPAQQSGARQHGDGAHSSSSGGSALWTGPARARACTWWSRTVEGTVTTTSTMCPVRSQVMREASLASAVIRACPQAMWVPWAALSAAAGAARSAAVAARSRSRRAAAVMATARVRNQSRRLRDTHQTVADPVSEYTGRIGVSSPLPRGGKAVLRGR